ncbi:MAG: hypothetical protein P4M09_29785, partial [Devosia sp.]|nr:hypothetical protein [Nevskia sp.]MDR3475858.1 hypothetical protein [Devosia sp.]
RSWRNAIYRALCSVPAGFIFAPAMPRLLWFLQGDDWDMRMAAACAAGFTTWFILEASARFLSSKDTMRRLLEEVVRLQGPGDREK